MLAAANKRGMRLALLDVGRDEANGAYAEALVLVRPDQHIAWRGQTAPETPDAAMARVTGAATGIAAAKPEAVLPA